MHLTKTITRQQLRDVTNEAIERADQLWPDRLTDEQKALLRHTAETSTRMARGEFTVGGCGCLVQQAGFRVPDVCMPVQITSVALAFDRVTSDRLGCYGDQILEVQG